MTAIASLMIAGLMTMIVSSAHAAIPAPTPAEHPDVCSLLSAAEVEKATGAPMAEGVTRLRMSDATACSFSGPMGLRVVILVRWTPAGDWVSQEIARMDRSVGLGTYHRISGVGERAFLYSLSGSARSLCIFDSGFYLQVSLYRAGEDPEMATNLGRLAASALSRLRLALPNTTHLAQ